MILETYQLEKYKAAMDEMIIEATWGAFRRDRHKHPRSNKNYMSTRRLK